MLLRAVILNQGKDNYGENKSEEDLWKQDNSFQNKQMLSQPGL